MLNRIIALTWAIFFPAFNVLLIAVPSGNSTTSWPEPLSSIMAIILMTIMSVAWLEAVSYLLLSNRSYD